MGKAALVGVLALAAGAAGVAAQQDDDFAWSGAVEPGDAIEIVGVNGPIEAVPAAGSEVSVTAVKTARKSDPDDVRIEVLRHDGGVTICAVYPTPAGAERENECAPGGKGRNSTRDNDVKVAFTVRVPAGVTFVGRTVNGDILAEGLAGDVQAHTVNGDVDVSTNGHAEAATVNGSIAAELGRLAQDASFSTVNGRITVEAPADLNADVEISAVNGGVESDFPLMVKGKFGRRSVRGTVGNGGPELSMKTVNGSIRLVRSS